MVSVNTSPVSLIIRDVYQTLLEKLKKIQRNSLEAAFATWVYPEGSSLLYTQVPSELSVTSYTDIACLAFLTEADPMPLAAYNGRLKDGLQRVAGRTITHLDTEPAPFRYDSIALLGLALGAQRIGGDVQRSVTHWMQSFIDPADSSISGWKRIFLYAALGFIGAKVDDRDLWDVTECNDIKLAFASKGGNFFPDVDLDRAYQAVCHSTITEDSDLAVAACRLQALHFISNNIPTISLSRPSVAQLITLLNNLPAGLKRWSWEEKAKTVTGTPQKWDLQNEYHVQSLVYMLLAPIFPDIEQEFYFEPTGQLNARADLGVPALNIIIEIKFLRWGTSFAKMIEEIAADSSLYFKKDSVFTKKYSKMIVFLWDDSARMQEHHEFKKGVIQLNNIEGVVVVSRPGNMPIQTKSTTKGL